MDSRGCWSVIPENREMAGWILQLGVLFCFVFLPGDIGQTELGGGGLAELERSEFGEAEPAGIWADDWRSGDQGLQESTWGIPPKCHWVLSCLCIEHNCVRPDTEKQVRWKLRNPELIQSSDMRILTSHGGEALASTQHLRGDGRRKIPS